MSLTYKQSGVDIEAGDRLVDWLKSNPSGEKSKFGSLISGIGGFSAIFKTDFSKFKNPCLVSATDGVGTKILLAAKYERFTEVAQDLVAMSVNDLICCGASPLFFLDYYSVGKLNLDHSKEFLKGVKDACLESELILIGGETAEMPGVYKGNEFDCAGFAVGVVDQDKILGTHKIKPGNKIIGLTSSGFHSNGYSLVRQLFDKDLDNWIDQLIAPTKLYVNALNKIQESVELNAAAHITGGGLDNLNRVCPKDCDFLLDEWEKTDLYKEAQVRSKLTWTEMYKTFNCGIGMALVLEEKDFELACGILEKNKIEFVDLGSVVSGKGDGWKFRDKH